MKASSFIILRTSTVDRGALKYPRHKNVCQENPPLWTRCWWVPAGASRGRPSLPGRGGRGTRPGRRRRASAGRDGRWRRTSGWWTAGLRRQRESGEGELWPSEETLPWMEGRRVTVGEKWGKDQEGRRRQKYKFLNEKSLWANKYKVWAQQQTRRQNPRQANFSVSLLY